MKLYDKERKNKERAELKLTKPDKVAMTAAERMRLMRAKRKPIIITSEKELKVKAEDSAKVDKFVDEIPQTKTPIRKNMYSYPPNDRQHNSA